MKNCFAIVNEDKLYDDKSFIGMDYDKQKKQFKKRIARLAQLQEEQYAAMKSANSK